MENKIQSKTYPRGTRTIWRYLSALILFFALSIGQMWGAWQTTSVDETIGTKDSISTDGLTREWNFAPATQQVKPSTSAFSEYNDMLFKAGSTDKLKSVVGSGWSCNNNSNIYIPVPAGSAGTITLYVYSTSDSRYLQLYKTKDNTEGTSAQRLYSKENAGGITSDGKKGPRSFSFTATDTTMINGVAYLHFKDNNTEMKISGFSIVLTAGSYPVASGPVDPTASFSNGDYTIGGSDLDLSSLFTTNSDGAVTYTITDQGTTDAALRADGKSFYATVAGSAIVKVEQASTSSYNAYDATATITVAACETSISGQPSNASLKVGDANPTLSITAANVAAYAWKESSDGTSYDGASTLGSDATYTPSVNDAVQIKYYYCEVTSSCSGSTVVKSNIVTVEVAAADPPCAELVPATSGDAPAAGGAISLSTATGGSMQALSANLTYTANGLQFGTNSGTKASVTLNHLMQETTVISVTLVANGTGARGLKLYDAAGSNQVASLGWSNAENGDEATFTYTVTGTDKLNGTNGFQLWRNNTVTLKSLKVFNCGAELFALNSAIYPAEAEGKATITLSKNFVENGGTATATYSAIDAAYDFDEWVISGEGASISSASANPVTITMGSNPATITLKLKAAGTKYAVHFDSKGGSAVADQSIDAGGHAAVPTAPTKFKYTFGGWSETDGGSTPANLAEIAINAEKTFYAIWTPKACPTSGTIYSFVSDGTKAPGSNTYCPASGVQGVVDIATYATVSGGLAQAVHTTTSNNPAQIQTSTSAVKLSHADGYFRALLECPLQEGDTIKFVKTNKVKMAFDSLRTKVVEIASGTGANKDYYIVPANRAGEDTIMVYYNGSSVNLTSLKVVRPEKLAVSFNMHGHGDQVAQQNIVSGGKVTEPATTDITGWDFGGWYKTYVAEPESYSDAWDFDNDVVSAATELHAKWTAHVASNDVALGTLSVNGEAITIVPSQTVYAVELPMGTTATPTVTATANDENVKAFTITQATAVDGSATIYVKAEDNTTEATYTINFSVATSKDIELVWDKAKKRCDDTTPSDNVKSDDASVSAYINKITFTGGGAEGSSLNVGNGVGNMFTLTAKAGYAFKAMTFFGKIQDATCEFSLDGGAWTELTSTNTSGDACYADVFSAAEVHELRLRSTGASGVWIRNMQLTIVEACTPIVLTWDEEPVEFEVGKAGYAIAATANNGGTITYASADNTIIDVNASTGALTIAGLGSVALSASTPEGDGSTYCANGGDPIVLSKAVNTYYLVTFDGQNGEAADEVKYYSGDEAIALPAAPSYPGYDFQGWFDAETGGNQYTAAITPTASTTVYAQWVAQCAGATITTQPTGASYLTGRTATALICGATAGNGGVLTYEWFTCDDELKTNPVAATATPSTAVAGTFYYFCKVTEEGCAVEAFSNVVTITVADKDMICIIKAIPTSATAADADGAYKGSAAIKSSAKKLSSKYDYVAVQLKEGESFLATDKVVLNQTANLSGESDITKFYIFTEVPADGKTYVTVNNASPVKGDNWFTMPAEMEGESSLYIGRVDAKCNPTVGYLAVYRACAPILNKITVNGVEGAPVANVVTMDVPASTTQSQLEAIAYDWISNNDEWTAAHTPVAANAWEFGVANTVTLTDKDGDESVYTITVNKAAASTNIELATLTVNGNAVTVVPGQYTYAYELPYGTSAVPAVVAIAADANANVSAVTADINSATFTVTAEDGTTAQLYTINFSVSKWAEVVIWDGSTMSAVATSPDATTGFAWSVNGFSSITSYNATCGTKTYTKTLPSGGGASASRNVAFTVPAGYVAKFYIAFGTHSDGNNRGMFIGSSATKTLDETSVLTLYSASRTNLTDGTSEIVGAGTYYLNPMESEDFYEIRAYVRPGYARTSMLGAGVYGTVCVDHNVAVEDIQGVSVYELMGRENNYGKLVFDEIISGELEAGAPYVFQANGDRMVLFYGETKVDEPVDKNNGMYGTFTDQTLTELADVYYFAQKALWSCVDLTSLSLPANRAYVKLSEIDYLTDPNPAPGRRRVTMSVNGEKIATGLDAINASEKPMKIMIDGQIYILRGEKMYDVTGKLVK